MYRWPAVWTLILAVACAAPFTSAMAGEDVDLKGRPNPDADHIVDAANESMITVQPRNDPRDYENLQWAVDNVAPGGTVVLGAGVFLLGDGETSPRRTVRMRRGSRVVGAKDGDTWKTIVRGGGEVINPGLMGPIESGAFRVVNESDPNPVVFENIWFREWACEVVFIEACQGFAIRGCRISHPANTATKGIRFVHAIWSAGAKARGDFTVDSNLVELGDYTDGLPDDEQLLGVFFSNHDTVRVTNNVIGGVDEAIEILGNRNPLMGEGVTGPSEIIVTGNTIDVRQQFLSKRWGGKFGILVAGNLNVDRVLIADNDITVRGEGWVFGLSGENLIVTGNRVKCEPFNEKNPAGVATIGFGLIAGRMDMGASLVNSVFENNTFEGAVRDYGIRFNAGRPDRPNASHGNRFDFGDSVAALGAATTLAVSEDLHGNTFTGDLGTVVDDSPEGANSY